MRTINEMIRRIYILLTISILWISALVAINYGSKDSPVFSLNSNNDAAWKRENDFIFWSNRTRLGEEPLLATQNGRSTHPNPKSIRILAVGDSATFGSGLSDLSIRWQEKLERLLDKNTRPGTFDVTTIAMWGASTYRFADWLTPDFLGKLKPDIIIIAVNGNDAIPTGDELLICPLGNCPRLLILEHTDTYQDCMLETANITPVDRPILNRVCIDRARVANPHITFSQFEQNALLLKGIYGRELVNAHKKVIAAADLIPVVVFPTIVETIDIEFMDILTNLWVSYGALRSPASLTREVVSEFEAGSALWANPVDRHPGPRLTSAYAKDLNKLILEILPANRLAEAKRSAKPRKINLVDNFLPAYAKISSDDKTAIIDVLPWLTQKDNEPAQFYPCAEVERVHSRVMFDPRLPPGTKIAVQVDEVDGLIYKTGYKDDTYFTELLNSFQAGDSNVITFDNQGLTGILIVPEDASNCDVPQISYQRSFRIKLTRL
jgi:lysophospholipase L1-like esterase